MDRFDYFTGLALHGSRPGRRAFMYDDGWGEGGWAEEDDDFVYRDGLAFPKWATCGNYRTPGESRYGYGAHVIQGPIKRFRNEGLLTDYDDRLRQFYPDRWEAAWKDLKQHLKQMSLKKLSAFLSIVYDQPVECLQLIEGCNVGNGYPYLIFVSRKVLAKETGNE